jgi:hypothetical protein
MTVFASDIMFDSYGLVGRLFLIQGEYLIQLPYSPVMKPLMLAVV